MSNTIRNTNSHSGLSRPLVLLLAITSGLAVASLYYSQPLLSELVSDLHANALQVGSLPTLTQMGYALGMLLINPLGDRFNRKYVIVLKGLALVIALLLTGAASGLTFLMFASFMMGVMATLAQDVVPFAAQLGNEKNRGQIVGTIMTGLLGGILLSRVLSGAISEFAGWRVVFYSAAAAMALVTLALWRLLPDTRPTTDLSYGKLMSSLAQLFRDHRSVRQSTLTQGLLAMGFSAFWTTLSLMLKDSPMALGSGITGLFGIAGACGVLLAPKFGKLADSVGPLVLTRAGAAMAFSAFALMFAIHNLGVDFRFELGALVFLTILFDLGFQMSLISNQAIIYAAAPNALSRVNAILIVGLFIGMSLGSYVASLLYADVGWLGVTAFATLCALCALVLRLRSKPQCLENATHAE